MTRQHATVTWHRWRRWWERHPFDADAFLFGLVAGLVGVLVAVYR